MNKEIQVDNDKTAPIKHLSFVVVKPYNQPDFIFVLKKLDRTNNFLSFSSLLKIPCKNGADIGSKFFNFDQLFFT